MTKEIILNSGTIHSLKEFILSSKGRIFSAQFVKRTTGKLRTINCRLGVRKGITGNGLRFNPKNYDLITVWDMHKKEFRFINLRTIKQVRVNKETLIVKH